MRVREWEKFAMGPSIPLHQRLYESLDRFSGGVESFLAENRKEVWRQVGREDWRIATVAPRRIMFGFFTLLGADFIGNPGVSVTLGAGEADLSSLLVEDIFGRKIGSELRPRDVAYICDLLDEVQRRKDGGFLTLLIRA